MSNCCVCVWLEKPQDKMGRKNTARQVYKKWNQRSACAQKAKANRQCLHKLHSLYMGASVLPRPQMVEGGVGGNSCQLEEDAWANGKWRWGQPPCHDRSMSEANNTTIHLLSVHRSIVCPFIVCPFIHPCICPFPSCIHNLTRFPYKHAP